MDKYYANKGVERNKTPLKNIIYDVVIKSPNDFVEGTDMSNYEKYLFKDKGYLSLYYHYDEKKYKPLKYWHGFITPEDLQTLLGVKQWSKFCQGKRNFIIQRRIDGKNISKNEKEN